MLWQLDPFLGNDRKISNYTMVVARQTSTFPWQKENAAILGAVFSTRYVLICYKQDQLDVQIAFEGDAMSSVNSCKTYM
jgi:hypothetical protein